MVITDPLYFHSRSVINLITNSSNIGPVSHLVLFSDDPHRFSSSLVFILITCHCSLSANCKNINKAGMSCLIPVIGVYNQRGYSSRFVFP